MHDRVLAIVILILALVGHGMEARAGDASERYVKKLRYPAGQVLVVAEGEFEPRSIGSYSIRIYSNARPEYPTDDYVCGIIRSRNGVVEDVLFADVDRDGTKEIIVTTRSVGTGSYLSADAYRFDGRSLSLVATVSDLPGDADPLAALMEMMRKAPETPSSPPRPSSRLDGADDRQARR